jgi:hypothetical protein
MVKLKGQFHFNQKLKIEIKKIWTKLKNKIKGQLAIFIE